MTKVNFKMEPHRFSSIVTDKLYRADLNHRLL